MKWNLFKVNNKDTITTSMTSIIFIIDIEQISHIVLVFGLLTWTSKCRLENDQ